MVRQCTVGFVGVECLLDGEERVKECIAVQLNEVCTVVELMMGAIVSLDEQKAEQGTSAFDKRIIVDLKFVGDLSRPKSSIQRAS